MAGRGPAPKRELPEEHAGPWGVAALARGWLGAPVASGTEGPAPATASIWEGWFRAWWAGHWTLDDLPQRKIPCRSQPRPGIATVLRVSSGSRAGMLYRSQVVEAGSFAAWQRWLASTMRARLHLALTDGEWPGGLTWAHAGDMGRLVHERRLHSTLGYVPPSEYEAAYWQRRAEAA